MFDFDDTEAAHLSEIYDDLEAYYEPYDEYEKREYIREKENNFLQRDKGKYVIVQNAKRNKQVVHKLYLVDRRKTKRWWWTFNGFYALTFDSKEIAEKYANKYHNCYVIQIK